MIIVLIKNIIIEAFVAITDNIIPIKIDLWFTIINLYNFYLQEKNNYSIWCSIGVFHDDII